MKRQRFTEMELSILSKLNDFEQIDLCTIKCGNNNNDNGSNKNFFLPKTALRDGDFKTRCLCTDFRIGENPDSLHIFLTNGRLCVNCLSRCFE